MQNTKSKTWGARRKGLTLLFLSLALSFFPLSYSFISRTVGMHRNVLYDIMRQVPLPKGYEVHHIDMNKLNNDINNLAVLTKSEHAKLHNQCKEWKDAQGTR